jgi:benzoyl-CoA reductase/2-hydroxyglutaryl-CoA dehydratase subunit BcrC/BadD/HgdB
MFAGIPELTLYLEKMLAELTDMTNQGKGFANPEHFRLMGLMIPPWHLQGTIDSILKEHNAAVVCYPNLCSWEEDVRLDPNQPLESIAKKMALAPSMRMFGPINERALNPIRKGIREYKIDGAINFTHIGCRQMGPSNKFFKDVLDEAEIPMLNIDCDLVDRTITSEDEVRAKMEQFFELLEDR